MTPPKCPVCHRPVLDPERHGGMHYSCATHVAEQVHALPCAECGNLTTVRAGVTETPTCSWCSHPDVGGRSKTKGARGRVAARPERSGTDAVEEWSRR